MSLSKPCDYVVGCSVFSSLIPKFVSIPASSLPLALINLLGFMPPIDGVTQPQSDRVRVSCLTILCTILPACASIAPAPQRWQQNFNCGHPLLTIRLAGKLGLNCHQPFLAVLQGHRSFMCRCCLSSGTMPVIVIDKQSTRLAMVFMCSTRCCRVLDIPCSQCHP